MSPKTVLRTLVVCVCLITLGCSSPPARLAQPTYVVNLAAPVKSTGSLEDKSVNLRNCEGLTGTYALTGEAQAAFYVIIEDTATSSNSENALILSEDTKAALSEKVQQTYQQIFDEAKAKVDTTTLDVPVGQIRTYDILFTQETYSSTVTFKQSGRMYSVSYTYIVSIPKAVLTMQTGCTG